MHKFVCCRVVLQIILILCLFSKTNTLLYTNLSYWHHENVQKIYPCQSCNVTEIIMLFFLHQHLFFAIAFIAKPRKKKTSLQVNLDPLIRFRKQFTVPLAKEFSISSGSPQKFWFTMKHFSWKSKLFSECSLNAQQKDGFICC